MANLLIQSRETIYIIYYILFLIALFYWVCCAFFYAKIVILREKYLYAVKKIEYIGSNIRNILYLLIFANIDLMIYKFVDI